jgi:hypothetical protein
VARSLTTKYDPSSYWRVVEDCLVELFGLPRNDAQNDVSEYRARLNSLPPDVDQDIVYHDEPFNVASDLADRKLSWELHQEQYHRILERHAPLLRLRVLAESASA